MRCSKASIGLLALSLCAHPSHRQRRPSSGQAGVFDFYLLVLSWSPEFCHSQPSAAQCAAKTGFIVHGLWPQNKDGSYPYNCRTNQPPPANTSSVADIMPPEIIQHEWQQHGTCSGLSGDDYLALVRKTFYSIHIPNQFNAPGSSFAIAPRKLKQEFERSDSRLGDGNIAIELRGHYLNAVEFCLSRDRNPNPVTCSNVKDAGGGTFIVPPVR